MSYEPHRFVVLFVCKTLICVLSLNMITLTSYGHQQQSIPTRELSPGQTIEGEMSGAESHRYHVDLKKDEFLQVRVEQKGIDIILILQDSSGKELKTMDSPNGTQGPEEFSYIAPSSGPYYVEVRSLEPGAAKGNYSVRLIPPRPSTDKDAKSIQAADLYSEAVIAGRTGNSEAKQAAMKKLEQARGLYREILDKDSEATCETELGSAYANLGDNQRALNSLSQALAIYRSIDRKSGEATVLTNLGGLYTTMGQNGKAVEALGQALPLVQRLGDKQGEAYVLTNLGNTYNSLGESQKAVDNYKQAVSVYSLVGDNYGKAFALTGIGNVYNKLGEWNKALDYLNQALDLRRRVGDKRGEAQTLSNIGGVYAEKRDDRKAAEYFEMSLPIRRAAGDRMGEGSTLHNLGGIYFELGERAKAEENLNQALFMRSLAADKRGEADEFAYLMHAWQHWGNLNLAVFFGKQAVNRYQDLRLEIQKLDRETQRQFLRKVGDIYERLANVLLAAGRPEEAVQVINLARDQEFFDFNQGPIQIVQHATLSPPEISSGQTLQRALEHAVKADRLSISLRQTLVDHQPTAAEADELSRLQNESAESRIDLVKTLKSIGDGFADSPALTNKVEMVQDVLDIQSALRELNTETKQRSVALYTLIADDKFRIVLISPDGPVKEFNTAANGDQINHKILQFYALLQSPSYDPRPIGKELYDIIFKPVEVELKRSGANTLMWQLHGSLRYIPLAALWDGEKYLVERFQSVVFTRANRERLARTTNQIWTGVGFGSSKPRTVTLKDGEVIQLAPLPDANAWLQSNKKIINGDVYVDDQFTESQFYQALEKHAQLIHIDSHFVFRPGDASRSFLLLGDGTPLTMDKLAEHKDLFTGVEMLTLSACSTAATQPDANGREIDGFAELAQRLGASSVLGSLWEVAEASTHLLMRDFYVTRQRKRGTTKADALRTAQLSLLNGSGVSSTTKVQMGGATPNFKVVIVPDASKQKSDLNGTVYISAKDAPPYKQVYKKRFSHPYYWAPFVLMGNWK